MLAGCPVLTGGVVAGMPVLTPSGMPVLTPSGIPVLTDCGTPAATVAGIPGLTDEGIPALVDEGMPVPGLPPWDGGKLSNWGSLPAVCSAAVEFMWLAPRPGKLSGRLPA
jgi:hypothetical protein